MRQSIRFDRFELFDYLVSRLAPRLALELWEKFLEMEENDPYEEFLTSQEIILETDHAD